MRFSIYFIFYFLIFSPLNAEFEISMLDNKTYRGKIDKISESKIYFIAQNKTIQIERQNVIKIENLTAKDDIAKDSVSVTFTDGSIVNGKIIDGSPQAIGLQTELLGFFSIDLTKIRRITFIAEKFEAEINRSEDDVLYFKSGDIMKGLIEEFGGGYVQIEHELLGSRKEKFSDLKYINFAMLEPFAKGSEENDFATIIGVDKCNLQGKILDINQDTLTLKLKSIETNLNISINKVKHIFFNNNNFVYLSDLPFKAKSIPYFESASVKEAIQLDKNYSGNAIRLNGQKFFKGVGTVSKTQIVYNLERKYKKFRSYIGIDSEIADLYKKQPYILGGSVIFRVYLDKKKVYESPILYHFSDETLLNIDVSGKRQMKLEVDFGDNAHVNDLANWADAILVR